MRKIIIPVDFSENSWNSIKCAIQYFKYERATFYLVHAYSEELYTDISITTREQLEESKNTKYKEVIKKLDQLVQRIHVYYPDPRHDFETRALFGLVIDEVNDLAYEENVDLIVMGTQGETADRELTFGSNTLQVLKYVKAPVLVIPSDYTYERPKHILFPTDFMLPHKRRELKLISCMAKSYRSVIHALYISNHPRLSIRQEDNKEFWEVCFRESEHTFNIAPEGELVDVINDFIKIKNIDLLVMVNSRHTYMESLMVDSTIDKIGLHATVPFLVLQNLQRN